MKFNKTILFNFLACLGLLCTIQSCSFNEFENSNRIINISNEIDVTILPDYKNSDQLKFFISTKESRYCEQSFIETQVREFKSKVTLQVQGIITPSNCIGLDQKLISIESFEKKDNFDVQIEFTNDLQSTISFTKQGDIFTMDHQEVDFFSFPQKELIIPSGIVIWMGASNSNTLPFNELKNLFVEKFNAYSFDNLEYGNYGYFEKNEDKYTVTNPENFKKYEQGASFKVINEVAYDQVYQDLLDFSIEVRTLYPETEFFISNNKGDTF